jgi:hypothetical protein
LLARHYKVFLLGGQSNMFGYRTDRAALPVERQGPQEDVLFYYGANFTFLQPGSGGIWGSEITFGRSIADAFPDENFYLIKHSDGGTSLWNEWNLTNGRSYNLFKEVVGFGLDALTRAGHTCEIVGMLWSQGERDAWNLRTTAQYEADFKAFIADIRSRYGADLPFLFTRLSLKQTARPIEAVRLAQELVAASDPNAYLIDADDYGILGDNLHYTAQGYIDMGRDFALAYLNSLPAAAAPRIDTLAPVNRTPAVEPSAGGIIAGKLITASASAISMGNLSFNFNNGTQAWHPYRTIDGSGLSGGVHDSATHTGWLTRKENVQGVPPDVPDSYIQWDLGDSYVLDAIHVWNMNRGGDTGASVRSVDVYFSNIEFPGDPEAEGAANWTRLGGASLEFPQAPASNNIGFDLATATSTTLPTTDVRHIRFELNSNWNGNDQYTGISEIQFKADSRGIGAPPPAIRVLHPTNTAAGPSADATAPAIDFLSPQPGATGVNPAANLILIFDEPVAFGSGAIHLRQSGGALIQRFDVGSPGDGLALSGKALTINPSADLADATTYYLEIDATAIDDLAGNSFVGISGENAWSFSTIVPDVTPPDIVSTIPASGSSNFFPANNLFVRFDEWIALGTGFFHLHTSDGTLVESFDVTDPASGLSSLADTVTINPSSDLPLGTRFYVEIESTAILDNAGNYYPGTVGSTTWTFSVPASVDYTTITHIGTQFDIEAGTNDPTFGWRNPSPVKPLDVDGDNILGTDGYRTSARTSDPSYAITYKLAPNENGGGKVYDDPLNPSGDDIGLAAFHDASAGNGQETAPLLGFEITEDLPAGTTLRVGILFDLITVRGGANTATYSLKQTFGGTATATTPAHPWTGETMDAAFFDLTNVRATHKYVITSTTISTPNHPGPFEQVIGVTFDTGTTGPDESIKL